MRASEFFTPEDPDAASLPDWAQPQQARTVLDTEFVAALAAGPLYEAPDVSAAIGLLDLVHRQLEAFGTDRSQHLDDEEIEQCVRALRAVTTRLGRPVKLPFRNFTTFRSYWYRQDADGPGGWQARRELLDELLEPAREWLLNLADGPAGPMLDDDTIAGLRDPGAIREQLDRIGRAVLHDDPALVIGSAKELIEATAKAVLLECGKTVNTKDDVPALASQAQRALGLHPADSAGPDGTDAVKKLLGSMSSVAQGLAELRNLYGTGHGAAGARVGLHVRHAQLAANAAVTWCQLLLDTLADPAAPWRNTIP